MSDNYSFEAKVTLGTSIILGGLGFIYYFFLRTPSYDEMMDKIDKLVEYDGSDLMREIHKLSEIITPSKFTIEQVSRLYNHVNLRVGYKILRHQVDMLCQMKWYSEKVTSPSILLLKIQHAKYLTDTQAADLKDILSKCKAMPLTS